MGLPKIIQIPCHHVLANQNALKLKKGAPLKQIFNINLGICIIKKTTFFVRIFDISPVFLLKFQSGQLIGCRIKFHIQCIPTWNTFDGPCYRKHKKYMKKCDDDIIITFFSRYFLFLGQHGSSKVCIVGTRWMCNLIPHPTSSPDQNLIKNTGRYVENTNKKQFFLFFLQN